MKYLFGLLVFCVVFALADGLYYRLSAKKDRITNQLSGQFGFVMAVLAALAYAALGDKLFG